MKSYSIVYLLVIILCSSIVFSIIPAPPTSPPNLGGSSNGQNELVLPEEEEILVNDTITPNTTKIQNTSNLQNISLNKTIPVANYTIRNVPTEKNNGANTIKTDSNQASINSLSRELDLLQEKVDLQSQTISELNKTIAILNSKMDDFIESKKSPSSLAGTIIVAVMICVIFAGVMLFVLYNKKTDEKPEEGSRLNQINMLQVSKLKNYISYNLRRGYNPHLLKNELLRQGHNREEIDLAFKNHYSESSQARFQ